jgi:hypothetical protein
MFKKVFLFLIIILVLFTSACGEKQVINNMTPDELVQYIDKRIDEKVPTQISRWFSATVVSISGGSVTIHLPTDPLTVNITAQNSGEIPLEIGDEVQVLSINGSLSNCIIGYRKTISIDDIYVSFINGQDSYGYNNSGYQYGSSDAPFKTLKYAMQRLPKNLNNRDIIITIQDAPVGGGNPVLFTDGFYGGNLTIQGLVGSYADVNTLWMSNCSASIYLEYLTPKNSGGLYLLRFTNCSNVSVNYCDLTTVETTGISATNNSSVIVNSSQVSNQMLAAFISTNNSRICCNDCYGSANGTIYYAQLNSRIGVYNIDNPPVTGSTTSSNDGTCTILIKNDYAP